MISTREIKLVVSVVGVRADSATEMLNLCAPLAAKLLEPVELSNRLDALSGVTIVSVTAKPTVPVYSVP